MMRERSDNIFDLMCCMLLHLFMHRSGLNLKYVNNMKVQKYARNKGFLLQVTVVKLVKTMKMVRSHI